MRLVDLDPRWLVHPDGHRAGLTFLCPCCKAEWLICMAEKTRVLGGLYDHREGYWTGDSQYAMLHKAIGGWNHPVQDASPCSPFFAWQFVPAIGEADFETLTLKPSLDFSPCGHWHGFIRDGALLDV